MPHTTPNVIFTVVTYERRPILCTEEAREALRSAVRETMVGHPFQTVAWVLLPDHLHCIWQLPDGDSDFTTRWRLIKSRFTRDYLRACSARTFFADRRVP